ncbi:hypothetical protein EG829_26995, partial [bacterium]|nr:hypothetical protein [bacterium]
MCEQTLGEARRRIPTVCSVLEVLSLRLDALRAVQSLGEVRTCLRGCGIEGDPGEPLQASDLDQLAERRVRQLREGIAREIGAIQYSVEDVRCRSLLRQWEGADVLVSAPEAERRPLAALRVRLTESDTQVARSLAARTVLWPGEGGFELFDLIGWKAANLAEICRIAGGARVPPWFVVTDRAFRDILDSPRELIFPKSATLPDGAPSLGKAIEAVLRQSRLDRFQKASLIRSLWSSVVLPESLAGEVIAAYAQMGGPDLPVALRSSSREEDAEVAARAGEFDTFLFIRGEQVILQYLLRTWSGLWSDRALHTREMLGTTTSFAGGGVIVQQIVNSRVSGVLQTINVARNDFQEIVINAGWGLGEGVVSGTVAADQVTVTKEGDLVK